MTSCVQSFTWSLQQQGAVPVCQEEPEALPSLAFGCVAKIFSLLFLHHLKNNPTLYLHHNCWGVCLALNSSYDSCNLLQSGLPPSPRTHSAECHRQNYLLCPCIRPRYSPLFELPKGFLLPILPRSSPPHQSPTHNSAPAHIWQLIFYHGHTHPLSSTNNTSIQYPDFVPSPALPLMHGMTSQF